MAGDRSVSSELSRDLSLFHITMMGLGMMIGAGVFVGIGLSVQGAGTGGLLLTMALNGLPAGRIEAKVVPGRNVVDTILDEAQAYDLIVLGCTREPILRQVARNPVPETVAIRCGKPLVMVRASGGIRSWIKRWV